MKHHRKKSQKRRKAPFQRRTPPGTAPGVVAHDPHRQPLKIHVFEFNDANLKESDPQDVRELPALVSPDQVVWIDIEGIGDADAIQQIGAGFRLHPLALEDVVHVHQRAKVEEFVDHLFIVARMHVPGEELDTEQVSMFLGKGWLITFQDRLGGDCFGAVRERLRQNRGRIRELGADYLAYCLIDAIIDDYFPLVERYGQELDAIEEELSAHSQDQVMRRLHAVRHDLLLMRRLLWPHRDAISTLLRGQHALIQSHTLLYLRDCYDHLMQLIDVSETFRDTCTEVRELYLSEINQRTNDITKVLTTIATLFLPLSFIASLYGMNFDTELSEWNMPELKWRYGYLYALGLMVSMEVAMLWLLWRRGWLKR